jgi:adenylate cyclase
MAASLRVRMEPAGVELDVPAGERLLDAADAQARPGLPVACRAASCGACLVRVLHPDAPFEPPAARERELLATLGATPDQRLGCQLRARASLPRNVGIVVLSAAMSRRTEP